MPTDGARVPRCGTHSPCGLAAFWACSPARFCEMIVPTICLVHRMRTLPAHESRAFDGVPQFSLQTSAAIKPGSVREPEQPPGTRGDPTREPPLKFRASDVRADARVESPGLVQCALRSKTSVTTNRSATAVNSAISVIVRSLIDLAVAQNSGCLNRRRPVNARTLAGKFSRLSAFA